MGEIEFCDLIKLLVYFYFIFFKKFQDHEQHKLKAVRIYSSRESGLPYRIWHEKGTARRTICVGNY